MNQTWQPKNQTANPYVRGWSFFPVYPISYDVTPSSNNAKKFYVTSVFDKSYFNQTQLMITLFCNLIVSLQIVALNSLAIIAIFKTKQFKTRFSKLILQLCVADLCTGVIVETLTTLCLLLDETHGYYRHICITHMFLSILFSHVSGYTIGLIGIDRFICIKYPYKYKHLMSSARTYTLMIVVVILSLFQSIWYLSNAEHYRQPFRLTVHFLLNIIILSAIMLINVYVIRAIYKIKPITSTSTRGYDEKIIKLSRNTMSSILVFACPYVIASVVQINIQSKLSLEGLKTMRFVIAITYIVAYFNSAVNAMFFINSNPKAKHFLKSFLS